MTFDEIAADSCVPDLAGLSMSDLVIGEVGSGTWRRGDVAISPLPGHQVASGGGFRLFYEIWGLPADEPVRTRITVAPAMDPDQLSRFREIFREKRVLELSFDETPRHGANDVVQVQRTIQPSLEPGRYRLQVRVERAGGQQATMETSLLILDAQQPAH